MRILFINPNVTDAITEHQMDDTLGPDWLTYHRNPSCQIVSLRPDDERNPITALVYIDRETNEGFLVTFNLSDKATYKLVAVSNETGEALYDRTFPASGPADGVKLGSVGTVLLASVTWEIRDMAGVTILRSA